MRKLIMSLILLGGIFLFANFCLAADLVNINTADAVELDTLPGIGQVKAQAIIDYRTQVGPFAKIEDIMNVSGIGQVTFDNMKDLITVGSAESMPTSTPTPGPTETATPTPTSTPAPQTNNTQAITTVKEILGYDVGSVVVNELVASQNH